MLLHLSAAVYLLTQVANTFFTTCKRYILSVLECSAAVTFNVANGGFTALRAYAIGNRSVLLALAIFLSSLVNTATKIYEAASLVAVFAPWPIGCIISSSSDIKVDRPLYVTGQASTIIPEVLLLAVTWRSAYHTAKLAKAVQIDTPFTMLFLRDGTIYFVTILVLLIINATLEATTVGISSPGLHAT
ncbi:uncharacterized protein B0H18DRAFT_493104 [Fomitopsis serialis]|uniref:uncharacterized protein n=1 Tax=Fomitopsis serialis TaxID=139415 RepID=UPI00200842E5|nr:uncharacterized protein B0H18DRAFT_493104 [Neoantrodia serialis]KAH9934933.1 hypothetical protein B0H18DRAFT_493104 [Neoantrodia serialis]